MQIQDICPYCGENIIKESDQYKCNNCGISFKSNLIEEDKNQILNYISKTYSNLQKDMITIHENEITKNIANARKNLYTELQKEDKDTEQVIHWCNEIKRYLPNDFVSNTYITLSGSNINLIKDKLNEIDVTKYEGFIEGIVNYMLTLFNIGYRLELKKLISRAWENTNISKYNKYITKCEEKVKEIDEAIFDTKKPRDVFIAYKNEDIKQVKDLIEYLESKGLDCFASFRNLEPRGDNNTYDYRLQEAIDSCRVFLFVSSKESRRNRDGQNKEIPYIINKDMDKVPLEYRNCSYKQIPMKYKKARVEYIIEDYENKPYETFVQIFFDGFKSFNVSKKDKIEEVFNAINDYRTNPQLIPKEKEKRSEEELLQEAKGLYDNKEYNKAFKKFEKLVNDGNAEAQYYLGECYYYGQGVTQDYSKAVYWFEQAANQGDFKAQYNLGVCYANGYGVTQDYSKAIYLLKQAAKQGELELLKKKIKKGDN